MGGRYCAVLRSRALPSTRIIKTFWRSRLHEVLRRQRLLRTIEVLDHSLRLESVSWNEYWTNTPKQFRTRVDDLASTWRTYIDSAFDVSRAEPYCKAYFELLRSLAKTGEGYLADASSFLSKVLGFENFVLKYGHDHSPFAAATTSLRNPVFLSFVCRGLRGRNDPSLIALLVGVHHDVATVYYNYRKQRLLRNTDESLLFFSAVDRERRIESFQGLEAMTNRLVDQWDSRIAERSRLLADKVLTHILAQYDKHDSSPPNRAFRILDIGSGVGLLTSKVVTRLAEAGVLGERTVELSLLDVFPVAPSRHFQSDRILPNLAKVEYISNCDYAAWIGHAQSRQTVPFNIVLICRMLHHLSRFHITHLETGHGNAQSSKGRYSLYPHMSDYYLLIARLLAGPGGVSDLPAGGSPTCYPQRLFDPSALMTPDGQSLIDALLKISRGIVIVDGDLSVDCLLAHVRRHVQKKVWIHDLSRGLRLFTNHIYWIAESEYQFSGRSELIWPS